MGTGGGTDERGREGEESKHGWEGTRRMEHDGPRSLDKKWARRREGRITKEKRV